MKKLLMISGGSLPVPAKEGGAVEGLIDLFVEQNEITPVYKVDIISCYCKGKTADKKYTDYFYIRYPILIKFMDVISYVIADRIRHDWKSMFIKNRNRNIYYQEHLLNIVSLCEYDYIVVENNMSLLEQLYHVLDEDFSKKCFYHMHSVFVDNEPMIPYLARCRKILTVSNYVKRELKNNIPEFVNTEIMKVTNGVSFFGGSKNEIEKLKMDERKKRRIDEKTTVFLYTGRLSPEKGVKELLQAYSEIEMSERKKLVLYIAGSAYSGKNTENSYTKELKNIARQCENDIAFLGYVEHDQIYNLYVMADVLVVPSIVGDAAPLTVIEGMRVGIRMILSNVGGIPEYTDTYENKIMVECDDKFIQNLKNSMIMCSACRLSGCANNSHRYTGEQYFQEMCAAIEN